MSKVADVEARLDKMYKSKKRYMSVQDREWMYPVIMTEPDVPLRVYQKFAWYQVYPINFNDDVCNTIWTK